MKITDSDDNLVMCKQIEEKWCAGHRNPLSVLLTQVAQPHPESRAVHQDAVARLADGESAGRARSRSLAVPSGC